MDIMELPWCPLYVLPCLVLLWGCTDAQLFDINPADLGVNCTTGEFVKLYLTCLLAYKSSDAIQNCEVQCSLVDNVTDCVRGIRAGALSRECLISMADVMVTLPRPLKELLFDANELDSCGMEVDSVLTVCPDLPSLLLPDWGPWAAFGDCTESCTEVRSRECLNVLSFRPPETAEGCEGESSESRPCTFCLTTTASDQGTPPAEWGLWGAFGDCTESCTEVRSRDCLNVLGFRPQETAGCEGESSESQPCTPCIATTSSDQGTPPAAGRASSLWHVSDYVLQGGTIIVLSRSLLWADVML